MAQQMASQFQPSKDGVAELMRQHGKNVNDIRAALGALNNPMVSGLVNRISPNMAQQLKQAGETIINENQGTSTGAQTTPQDIISRLAALK